MNSFVFNSDVQNLLIGFSSVVRGILVANLYSFENGLEVLFLNLLFLILFLFGLYWIEFLRICGQNRLVIVASVVGKPLTLDLTTKEKHRLSYACVC